ncbi:CP2 transcription factor [Aspergillus keveii]|uniref:CP2 transcription factor n=1 Tax=Aspergillus keveii TaxID=714993 RepID=A0ABR4FGX3_9EURO
MLKQRDEIPVTYLNKGQAYCISILDTCPPLSDLQQVRYRTNVRISFHREDERLRSIACWQHWKECRGLNEAHQSGREPHAVGYVKPTRVVMIKVEKSVSRVHRSMRSAFHGPAIQQLGYQNA